MFNSWKQIFLLYIDFHDNFLMLEISFNPKNYLNHSSQITKYLCMSALGLLLIVIQITPKFDFFESEDFFLSGNIYCGFVHSISIQYPKREIHECLGLSMKTYCLIRVKENPYKLLHPWSGEHNHFRPLSKLASTPFTDWVAHTAENQTCCYLIIRIKLHFYNEQTITSFVIRKMKTTLDIHTSRKWITVAYHNSLGLIIYEYR